MGFSILVYVLVSRDRTYSFLFISFPVPTQFARETEERSLLTPTPLSSFQGLFKCLFICNNEFQNFSSYGTKLGTPLALQNFPLVRLM